MDIEDMNDEEIFRFVRFRKELKYISAVKKDLQLVKKINAYAEQLHLKELYEADIIDSDLVHSIIRQSNRLIDDMEEYLEEYDLE